MDAFEMLAGMGAEEASKVSLLEEAGGGHVQVEMSLPDGKTARKDLPISHPELRQRDSFTNADAFKVGDEVKVWSNSGKSWCKGSVQEVRSLKAMEEVGGVHVVVKFNLPDGKEATKELPMFHKELQKTYKVGDKVDVWSNTHDCYCPAKVLAFRPQLSPPTTCKADVELKVSAKRGVGFYSRAAENFLKGTPAKEASGDKPAVEAKAAVDTIKISGTGEAINIAAAVASKCESAKWGNIVTVETAYPELSFGRGTAQLSIVVRRHI